MTGHRTFSGYCKGKTRVTRKPEEEQLNLGRAKLAHDVGWHDSVSQGVDLMVVSEPNVKICSKEGWILDKKKDVAVRVCNRNLEVAEVKPKKGYIRLVLPDLHVYAVYISPNVSFTYFKRTLDEIFECVEQNPEKSIIMGDINAKSQTWGSPIIDERREYVDEWLSQLGWVAANNGDHTFERGSSKTHIDVTLTSESVFRRIRDWTVQHSNPYTYHGNIGIDIKTARGSRTEPQPIRKILRADHFRLALQDYNWEDTTDIYRALLNLFNASIIEENGASNKWPYWWNENIDDQRKKYNRLRRIYSRLREKDTTQVTNLKEEMRVLRRNLRKSIRRSKREHWKTLLDELDDDIWGEGYRIATRHLAAGKLSYQLPTKKRRRIIKELFPTTTESLGSAQRIRDDPEPFTEQELLQAVASMKIRKAPGPDGLTVEALKIASQTGILAQSLGKTTASIVKIGEIFPTGFILHVTPPLDVMSVIFPRPCIEIESKTPTAEDIIPENVEMSGDLEVLGKG
ncbi:uncharacterized protein LOC123313923 [Coccinella septempunctata]|uniref:uncharacterized protein LOC123313923 n=1 Tax=Coccinella septempunctata TaxID=41139 RepID=UPI001D091849|nr:uncharacterized protein LOC123313923 [Coccinella septempunctata]